MNELWGSTYTQVRLAAVFLALVLRQEAKQLLHGVIERANTAQITLAELWLSQGKTTGARQLLAHLPGYRNLTPVQQGRVEELTVRHFSPENALRRGE